MPAYLVAVLRPQVFVVALQLAGSLRLVLFGLLPCLMVWRGRRQGLRPWVRVGPISFLATQPWLL